jgi:histidine triad (HIT) family protein
VSGSGGAPAAWPKEVRRAAEDARAIGLSPVVSGEPGGGWTVAVEGEHVRATAVFAHRGGKTRPARGELTVDGEPYPLAESWEELREIWDKYEGETPEPAGLPEISDPGGRPVPEIVRTTAALIEGRLQGAVPVRTGVSGDRWLIGVDGRDGDGLRLAFTRCGRTWAPDGDQPVQVIVGGEDRSAEAEGDIGKAVALALGGTHPDDGAAGASAVRRRPAFRDTGVETRRMVVKRELPGGKLNGKHLQRTKKASGIMSDCVFCGRVGRGEYDAGDAFAVTFRPLNPVGPGHRLFIPRIHVADALDDPLVTAMTARFAAEWAAREGVGACNLITSRGPEATQSVYHLHWHLLPRLKNDGLHLPWTGQSERTAPSFGELDEHLRPVDTSQHDIWHLAAYLPQGREEEVATWMALHGISLYRMYQSADLFKELRQLREGQEEAARAD